MGSPYSGSGYGTSGYSTKVREKKIDFTHAELYEYQCWRFISRNNEKGSLDAICHDEQGNYLGTSALIIQVLGGCLM